MALPPNLYHESLQPSYVLRYLTRTSTAGRINILRNVADKMFEKPLAIKISKAGATNKRDETIWQSQGLHCPLLTDFLCPCDQY